MPQNFRACAGWKLFFKTTTKKTKKEKKTNTACMLGGHKKIKVILTLQPYWFFSCYSPLNRHQIPLSLCERILILIFLHISKNSVSLCNCINQLLICVYEICL